MDLTNLSINIMAVDDMEMQYISGHETDDVRPEKHMNCVVKTRVRTRVNLCWAQLITFGEIKPTLIQWKIIQV